RVRRSHTKPSRSVSGTDFEAPPRPPQVEPEPPQPPPPTPPPADAVRLFQSGMEALQRHQYAAASDCFAELTSAFPAERPLLDRARVYLELCQREMRRRPAELGSPEERVTAATAALNNDDEVRAAALVDSVLAEDGEHDLALYLSAAIHARRGQAD